MSYFTRSIRTRNGIATVAFAALVFAAAGCGSTHRRGVAGARKTVRCASGYRTLGSSRQTWAALVRRPTTAERAPGGAPFAHLATQNVNRYPMVLGVLGERRRGCAAEWYRVELPLKPNGVTGWVRAADVVLAPVKTRVLVDVSARRVTLFRHGRVVLTAPAAVGSPSTPTPTGRFYVNQRLVPDDPAGPFGPGAIGISAFSNVLTGWTQGGPIAIHGTNEPWSIGHDVSNGCIRVRNDVLRRLFAVVYAGTPVLIRP